MEYKRLLYIIFILFISLTSVHILVEAATSDAYKSSQDNAGPMPFNASTSNYNFKAVVGEPGSGISTSTNYIYEHGAFWDQEQASTTCTIKWATPEGRSGTAETNDHVTFYLIVKGGGSTVLITPLATTSHAGTTSEQIDLSILGPGSYDIGIKTNQHITKMLRGVAIATGTNVLNFTQANNSSSKGSVRLLAGDVNGAGNTTSTLGDDVINSVDASLIISQLDQADPTSDTYRGNLNFDSVVNAVDLSLLIKNLDVHGDQ